MASTHVHHLELDNFKSYQGKVHVGPFQNFSCIVGPNGSGKSNLMDAMSFVLGNANQTMRAGKPEDFINKSSKRKECSVTLVMQDSVGKQTALRRAVKPRGVMELSVDGHVVSEKEFTAVLRKFKLNARLSTFLVFQHEVEAVAQKKAKELTELLELVSGSADLKAEYDARRRALDAANGQLTAASLEKRGAIAEVSQLRLHKKEADKYAEIHERVSEERRMLALCELFHLETQLGKQRLRHDAATAEVRRLQTAAAADEDVKKMKTEYAGKHKGYLESLKKARAANSALREKKVTLERIKASMAHYEKKLAREKGDLDQAEKTGAVRRKEADRLKAQLDQQKQMLQTLEAKWAEEEKDVLAKHKIPEKHMAEYRNLRRDADCASVTKRQEMETVRRNRDSVRDAVQQVELQIENQEALIKDTVDAIARGKAKCQELNDKIQEQEQTKAELTQQLDEARAGLHQMQSKTTERDETLKRLDTQLRELRSFRDDNRSSRQATDALNALRALHPGIRGRLVDLCSIPQDKYKNAVTVALGRNLGSVVVDTTETAMACVRYLKEQRVTSMSFIPIASAQGKAVDDSLRTLGSTCKPIVDVLQYDASLEPAIRYAVGQCLVCDNMEEAKRVAYGSSTRHKVVTVDGTVLLKNGSIQGGLASIQSRAKKWDDKHYETIKAKREQLARDVTTGGDAEEAKAVMEAKDLQSRIEYLTSKAARDRQDVQGLEKKTKAQEKELHRHQEHLAVTKKRLGGLEGRLQTLEKGMDAMQAEVTTIERKFFADFQKKTGVDDIADLEHRKSLLAKQRAEKGQQLQVTIHKLESALESEQKRVGIRSSADAKKTVTDTEKQLQGCLKDHADYQKAVDTVQQKQAAVQAEVTAVKQELDKLEEQIRHAGKANEQDMRNIAAARKQATMLQAACDATRQARTSLFQRCQMEEVSLPVQAGDDAKSGGKRRRKADHGREFDDADAAADEGEVLLMRTSEAFTSFSGGEAAEAALRKAQQDKSICIDFQELTTDLRRSCADVAKFTEYKSRTESLIDQLERELEGIAPNLKASLRFESSEKKLGSTTSQVDKARDNARQALSDFTRIKETRTQRFMQCFETITGHVDKIYRDLTMGTRAADVHGSAYLALEDADEPYNGGTRYHATPPMKRFMTMDQLSGGERTMAALALLFAIHTTNPAPFFVLDEVDAALDIGNVQKLAHYLRAHAGPGAQFIVVSLKEQLYHMADSLVGVYKDSQRESSGILTMDLRQH